jgi:hypothetical protein
MADETMNNYVQPVRMTPEQFMAASFGTFLLEGTNAKTGSFAGFKAIGETVIASMKVNGLSVAPATQFGSATIEDTGLRSVGYGRGEVITEITLTSGSLLLINAQ